MNKRNSRKCAACDTEIVFLPTKFGKQMPVTASSLTAEDWMLFGRGVDVPYRHGEHVSHFSDCEQAQLFRGK